MNINVTSSQTDASARDGEGAGAAPTILVVDDVEDNRDILTRRLRRRGYDIVEAENGTQALQIVERERIDLILLDIMMPDINGTEVVRRIRETRSQSELPIIMVSAKTLSEDVAESLELGANDYVIKPVDFTVALARIRAQLESKRIADEAARAAEAERAELARAGEALAEDNRKSRENLAYLAYHDSLTGLANRAAFRGILERTLADPAQRDRGLRLLFVDLDRFKAINDVYGHHVGDVLLKQVSTRLADALRGAVAVGRLGGDEFAALIAEDGADGHAVGVAARVIETISEPFEADDQPRMQIGATVGIAQAELCDYDAERLMKAADLAMYRAKADGRGRAMVFESRLLEEQRERSELEVELRGALRDGQFELYYQPLLDSATKELSCFEALLRWNHPRRGRIAPGTFIPAAEASGLIDELGVWVLHQACRDALEWPDHIRVAVNISPRQFTHADLIGTISSALRDTGLPPDRLEIEITENCLLDAGQKNVEILGAIRELGVRVAIDDFGTGYSSMTYLQNFVFDKLKIDRRFVSEMETNSKTSAIIDAIVRLGTTIGISTTAEGVETEAQLEAVIRHGCSEVQGFLLGEPLPLSQATRFIAQGKTDEPEGS